MLKQLLELRKVNRATRVLRVNRANKGSSPDNNTYEGKVIVNQFIAAGDLVRIKCRLENKKYKTVLCVSEKFASAMGGLLSKKVAGQDVRTTTVPRRMRLG